mmetsp:Transcript_3009/g.10855  ORF Transcript_3009/g.10855 Transcript_3009/m.10855 type:complete len:401 (+) Transcript_3009:173-1375(+)|eukprot:scaffold1766_cov401-Prasinococcus_capsulatus_cf.AAC.13
MENQGGFGAADPFRTPLDRRAATPTDPVQGGFEALYDSDWSDSGRTHVEAASPYTPSEVVLCSRQGQGDAINALDGSYVSDSSDQDRSVAGQSLFGCTPEPINLPNIHALVPPIIIPGRRSEMHSLASASPPSAEAGSPSSLPPRLKSPSLSDLAGREVDGSGKLPKTLFMDMGRKKRGLRQVRSIDSLAQLGAEDDESGEMALSPLRRRRGSISPIQLDLSPQMLRPAARPRLQSPAPSGFVSHSHMTAQADASLSGLSRLSSGLCSGCSSVCGEPKRPDICTKDLQMSTRGLRSFDNEMSVIVPEAGEDDVAWSMDDIAADDSGGMPPTPGNACVICQVKPRNGNCCEHMGMCTTCSCFFSCGYCQRVRVVLDRPRLQPKQGSCIARSLSASPVLQSQ